MGMNNEEIASKAVDAIFDDLRDRRFLKWLFKEEETVIGDFVGLRSLDLEVQMEIRQSWIKIISVSLSSDERTDG